MKPRKIFAGDRLKRARERAGLRQSTLAGLIAISPSYLNQLERDQRPLTPGLLQRLAAALHTPETAFVDTEDTRRAGNLREFLSDPVFRALAPSSDEIQSIVRAAPRFTDAFITLYQAYSRLEDQIHTVTPTSTAAEPDPRFPYDEVRDWVQTRQNHFAPLDTAAERLFEDKNFTPATLREDLARLLSDTHGITTETQAGLLEHGNFWRLESPGQRLVLTQDAAAESQTFWMAHVIAQLDHKTLINREVRRARFSNHQAEGLARIALANYFAGALLMPYGRFHAAAIATRHDLQRLQRHFAASFEQICHRLSTLQRPGLPGIPFYFAKTDIAGNILKRASATPFQFAQFGGPCPLWNVFRAFTHPGEIQIQRATTPDEITYLNIARTVGRGGGSYLSRPRNVAVVLGCELRHATQTVYATGLDTSGPAATDLIGPGCRACTRISCRHRSVPPLGHTLDTGTAARGAVPYRVRAEI